jgi:hypothetical protein
MKNGSIHRELNRSFYFAGDYDYPIALGEDPLGSILVFHCPNKFDLLEIEDAESGKQIDTLRSRDMEFHSRLGLSPNGRFLIDAGWFWHPWCGAAVLEIVHTDEGSIRFCKDAIFAAQDEIQSISFMEDARLIISSALNYFGEKPRPGSLGPKQLGNWSINDRRWESIADLNEPTGPIMPWKEWVVSFYEHPKLIELTTGKIVHQWERIYCGKQIGPIELGDPVPPPMAFDPLNGRFAVADSKTVTIVTL